MAREATPAARTAGGVDGLAGRVEVAPGRLGDHPPPVVWSARAVDPQRRRRTPGPSSRRRPPHRRPASGAGCAAASSAQVAGEVRRSLLRPRRHQLGQPGDAGEHQQRVHPGARAPRRCRCPAGRPPSAAAHRRLGARSRRTAAAPACRPPPGPRPLNRRSVSTSTPCPGATPNAVGIVRSVLLATHQQAVPDPDRGPHDVAPAARRGRSR